MPAPKLPHGTGYISGPSRWPNEPRDHNPALAATSESYPLTSAYGPVGPNPVIEQWTRAGLNSQSVAAPMFHEVLRPGANPSMTTSAEAANSRSRC